MERDCWMANGKSYKNVSWEEIEQPIHITQIYFSSNCKIVFLIQVQVLSKFLLLPITARLDSKSGKPVPNEPSKERTLTPSAKDGLTLPAWPAQRMVRLRRHPPALPTSPNALMAKIDAAISRVECSHATAKRDQYRRLGCKARRPAGEAGGGGQARFVHSICVARSSQK